jgi:hypothetical protein
VFHGFGILSLDVSLGGDEFVAKTYSPKFMIIKSPLFVACCLAIGFISTSGKSHGQVFSDDFSASTFEDRANGYLGGFYGSNVSFDKWFGVSSGTTPEATITGGSLNIESTSSSFRGAFLVLAPSVFGSDTEFSLTLDVTALNLGASGNSATARVFTGTGYDLTLSSANALFINAQTGGVTPQGSASVALAAESPLALGAGQTLDFTRPVGHAVMVFIGASGPTWPHPTMSVGEMRIDVIPEPSAFMLVGVGSLVLFRRKRPGALS